MSYPYQGITTEDYERFVESKLNTPVECSMLGLTGEVGELLDRIKKQEFHGHVRDTEKCINEAGDILFYLTDVCKRYIGCTLQDAMNANMLKLNKRYPNGFTKEESVLRRDVNVK